MVVAYAQPLFSLLLSFSQSTGKKDPLDTLIVGYAQPVYQLSIIYTQSGAIEVPQTAHHIL